MAIAIATAIEFGACRAWAAPPPLPADPFATELARLINDYRLEQGLAPLGPADELDRLAWSHTAEMVDQGRLSHDGFRDRYLRTGSRICVENVARNFRTPQALLEGWQHSPSHRRNLLEPKVVRMAIAAQSRYVTYFACR